MTTDPILRFKEQFNTGAGYTHLNNAGLAPISRVAREAVEHWVRRFYEEGMFCDAEQMSATDQARASLAQLLGARPNELAFFQSTAGGLSQFAFGMDLKPQDEILMWDQEYPSSMYPWKVACERSGAKLVLASSGPCFETPLEELVKHVTPKTRVIALSWVQYQTGAMTDLKALSAFARPRGILTVVDVIQGAGCLPFNFADSGLDAVAGGSHKWLCSPLGVGFLCVREEVASQLKPIMVGALTFGSCNDKAGTCDIPKTGALKFESGSKQTLELVALSASARLFSETGLDRIAQEAEHLARKLVHGLKERGYLINSPHGTHHRGAFVNFSPGKDSRFNAQPDIEAALIKAKISFARRGPGLRLSPHAFNTEDDIARVLAALV